MPRQLTFDLPVRPALGREDFFVSPANSLAVRVLEDEADWPGGKMVLIGPEGAGKTHLAHVWAAGGAEIVTGSALGGSDIARIARARRVAVEDADRIGGRNPAERALFHLHNLVLAEGGRLLITARTPPTRWRLALPDLASRMEASGTTHIELPDDTLLGAVLVKLFADRQLAVPAPLVPWLVARMDRSLAFARLLVETLDREALSEGRAVTRPLAVRVLDMLADRDR